MTNFVFNQYLTKPSKDVYYSGSYQRSAEAERSLWASVLLAMVHDLYIGSPRERTDAERWVGTYPSADFKEVVTLAGLDPVSVFDRLRAVCLIPHGERKQAAPNFGVWSFGVRERRGVAA